MNPQKPQKKRGEISVHMAFGIIYALMLAAIFLGPAFFDRNDPNNGGYTTIAILINGGFLLIIATVVLHIVLALRENKKKR